MNKNSRIWHHIFSSLCKFLFLKCVKWWIVCTSRTLLVLQFVVLWSTVEARVCCQYKCYIHHLIILSFLNVDFFLLCTFVSNNSLRNSCQAVTNYTEHSNWKTNIFTVFRDHVSLWPSEEIFDEKDILSKPHKKVTEKLI